MAEQLLYFSLEQVCRSLPMAREQVIEIVHLGIIQPIGQAPTQWQFDIDMLAEAKRAWRLHRQLELDWPGVAVALQLLDQIDELKRENQRLHTQLNRFVTSN